MPTLENAVNYFITITFSDENAPSGTEKEQFDETYKRLKKLLQQACTGFIVPEFTKKGRIHYHGVITFHNRFLFYRKIVFILKEEYGPQIYVRKCNNTVKVRSYCLKDMDQTQLDIEHELPIYFEKQPLTPEEKRRLQKRKQLAEKVRKELDICDILST